MIKLHRLNGDEIAINAGLIESVEARPDTLVSLATGNRFVVKETVDEVIERMIGHQRRIFEGGGIPNPIEGWAKKR